MSELQRGVCRRCGANRWEGKPHKRTCSNRDDSDNYWKNKTVPIRLPRALRRLPAPGWWRRRT